MILQTDSGEKFYVFKLGETLGDAAQQIVELTLENNGGNRLRTAKTLDISPHTLRTWIKKYEITDPKNP